MTSRSRLGWRRAGAAAGPRLASAIHGSPQAAPRVHGSPRAAPRVSALAAATFVLGVAASAIAQTATPLDRLDPAPPGDSFFTVPDADVRGTFRPAAGVLLAYSRDPLILK